MLQTRDVGVYGAGLYSFFRDYNNCESPYPPLPPANPYPLHLPFSTPAPSHPNNTTNPAPPIACSYPQFSNCQTSILSIEGAQTTNIKVYNLNTVGASSMVSRDGKELASAVDNRGVFPDGIAVLKVG